VPGLPKWVWPSGRDGLRIMPMHLLPNVLDQYIPRS
jgi:hypothetical protein